MPIPSGASRKPFPRTITAAAAAPRPRSTSTRIVLRIAIIGPRAAFGLRGFGREFMMVRRCIVVMERWGRRFVRMIREDVLKGGRGRLIRRQGKKNMEE